MFYSDMSGINKIQNIENISDICSDLCKKLYEIQHNSKVEKFRLPKYIYEDQDEIAIYDGKLRIRNNKTYLFDCMDCREAYRKCFSGKMLIVPRNMYYLIIVNYEDLECYLDLTQAIELEYLELRYTNRLIMSKCKKIINWAPNLKYLILDNYIYPLDNLPASLKYLVIPGNYNHPLDNLPSNLIGLTYFSHTLLNYNYSLDNLPVGLKYLELGDMYFTNNSANPFDNFPSGLEILNFDEKAVVYPINNLPDSIKFIKMSDRVESMVKLPSELKILDIAYYKWFVEVEPFLGFLDKIVFPSNFEKIIIVSYVYGNGNKSDLDEFKQKHKNLKIETNII